MIQKFKDKQPRLINRLIRNDNARLHTAQMTVEKLQGLDLELLLQHPYAPEPSPHCLQLLLQFGLLLNKKTIQFRQCCKAGLPGIH